MGTSTDWGKVRSHRFAVRKDCWNVEEPEALHCAFYKAMDDVPAEEQLVPGKERT